MPRYYPNHKRCQLNLTLDVDAFEILEQLAPSKRSYGHLLSRLLRDCKRSHQEEQLCQRFEAVVTSLEQMVGQQHG